MTRARGFSLVELMIALLLVCLALGVVAGLVQEYARVVRHDTLHGHRVNLLTALDRIENELREAVSVQAPAVGAAGEALKFTKPIPSTALGRFDPSRDPDAVWDPYADSYLMEVSYRLADGRLERAVRLRAGGSGPQTALFAAHAAGFQVSRRQGLVRLSASLLRNEHLLTGEREMVDRWL
ncbi:MAG: prepilin-type N-terminal cleavage/methylation domain-containing protein [Armatimonadetes bacterium]|nr:prepilin-type N-terminal cleavage/methylation domain-containing protein [Armatimonadota bacterium]